MLCDKPAGITSHDIVYRVRREHGGRVGHAGTLDPFATGLLIVLLGRATRLQQYVLSLPKTYIATARLGWCSSTGDPEGELTKTGQIPARLELPSGSIEQTPPMTSAVRVDGERLYKKARRGEDVARPSRTVEIYRAELLDADGEQARFEIRCSAGTYIRTLVEELEDAYCAELRRTAIGDFSVEDCSDVVQPIERLLHFLPERTLSEEEARQTSHGIPQEAGPAADLEGPVRLTHDDKLIAVARVKDGLLRADVVLA